MLIDQLVIEGQQALPKIQQRILQTAERHGLRADNAISVGSVALAMNDLYVVPSDMDVVRVSPGQPQSRIGEITDGILHKLTSREQTEIKPSPEAPLRVTELRGFHTKKLIAYLGFGSLKEFIDSRRIVHGLATAPPECVAMAKAERGSISDPIQLVQAHAMAMADKHPVTREPLWQKAIVKSLARLIRSTSYQRPVYPEWLTELLDNDFEHPAFAADEYRWAIERAKFRLAADKMPK